MGSTYKHYRDDCALCGDNFPTRDLNKLFIGASHSSVPAHKTLCKVCDYCLPKLLDFLAVPEPEDKEERPYTPRRWCRKCIRDVGKTANFCPYCGDELDSQKKDD